MKFLCDDNLGKLAKYLRILGYDTFFKKTISDAELLAVMLKQNRLVLTRDHNLIKKIEPEKYILVETDSPDEQLRAVIRDLSLKVHENELFSRCLVCNEICHDVTKNDIADEVFPYTIKTQKQFKKCPACGRIYWQGSHYKDMVEKLKAVIGETGQ
jgi:uncharacterized protein with PIN domain